MSLRSAKLPQLIYFAWSSVKESWSPFYKNRMLQYGCQLQLVSDVKPLISGMLISFTTVVAFFFTVGMIILYLFPNLWGAFHNNFFW
jgi:hypothetical protein